MKHTAKRLKAGWVLFLLTALVTFACNLPNLSRVTPTPNTGLSTLPLEATPDVQVTPTPETQETPVIDEALPMIPTQAYAQYDMMPYTVQAGDTLPALAARFRTNVGNILADNSILLPPGQSTTLEPGLELTIRLNEDPFWDAGVVILPNSLFINGPSTTDFDVQTYLDSTDGWLRDYADRSGEQPVSGAELVNNVAANYSINSRLLLALLEYRLNALTGTQTPNSFSLGNYDPGRQTLGRQLSWAANVLNNAYYGWRQGVFIQYTSLSGFTVNPSPWQNAATVAIQSYFSRFQSATVYEEAITNGGFLQTYENLFGPVSWDSAVEWSLIPADLRQPYLRLPFLSGLRWAYTAGPHSGWGTGYPWAAIDFAPPAETAGCTPSQHWAVAVADGLIIRSEDGLVLQDLDGDGNGRTGWVILYLHVFPDGAPAVGDWLSIGDRLGHPSCTGGTSTGRNLHIARLYNGEWISADGVIPLNLDGWQVQEGIMEYKGALSRDDQTIYPSNLGVWSSQLTADP